MNHSKKPKVHQMGLSYYLVFMPKHIETKSEGVLPELSTEILDPSICISLPDRRHWLLNC